MAQREASDNQVMDGHFQIGTVASGFKSTAFYIWFPENLSKSSVVYFQTYSP